MSKLFCTSAVVLVFASKCLAHDTWLSPSTYSARETDTITFDLTSGMEFPTLDAGPKPERVAKAGARISGEEREIPELKPGANALRLAHSFGKTGTAVAWVQLKPKEIELSDEDVAHYLEEAHAPADVQQAWAEQKGRAKWKELYTKCAKTCLRVGDAAEDRSWAEPVGMALEFVPLADPTTLRVGQQASSSSCGMVSRSRTLLSRCIALQTTARASKSPTQKA